MKEARLFVGTFLDAQRASLVEEQKLRNKDLQERWQARTRFVPAPKLHLTWFFIGNVESDRIDSVKAALQSTIAEWKTQPDNGPFQIQYDSAEVWPSLRSPRVLVLESTKDCPQAGSLNSAITNALIMYAEKNEKIERFKRFRPHLTICRFSPDGKSTGKNRSIDDLRFADGFFPLSHEIRTISLIKSDLDAGPNSYSSIFDLALD